MPSTSRRHVWQLLDDYVKHYHLERNHQGLDNQLIVAPEAGNDNGNERGGGVGAIRRRIRLGGLLSYYHRDAA